MKSPLFLRYHQLGKSKEYSCWSSGRSHVQNLGSSRCNSPFAGDYAETQADGQRLRRVWGQFAQTG